MQPTAAPGIPVYPSLSFSRKFHAPWCTMNRLNRMPGSSARMPEPACVEVPGEELSILGLVIPLSTKAFEKISNPNGMLK